MKTYLVTGGSGFIGSHFIAYVLERNSTCRIINLDSLTYAADPTNLKAIEQSTRYSFVYGNICNRELLRHLFREHDIIGVIHLAAESHVDNSIKGPSLFVQSNVVGTHALLQEAYDHWFSGPFQPREGYETARLLHVSTDEVYGSLGKEGYFTETSPYAPNSPYSATKASSDLIVRSYYHTFGMNVVITNCSNNFGPHQHDEKLVPTIIRNALEGNPIPIYGDGTNVRDWLYVDDHCQGLLLAFENGVSGETYNIGGGNERTNNDIVNSVCQLLDQLRPLPDRSYRKQVQFVPDRPGHDRRYAIDASKIKSELGWSPEMAFEAGIRKTVQWYLEKYGSS